jgi:hypothetical protein
MGFLDKLKGAMTSPAARAQNWPAVTAKLHEWSFYEDGHEWILDFCYSYQYEGEFYSGERQWHLLSPVTAERMGTALEPMTEFSVRVDPHSPEKSWLTDEEIAAHGVDLKNL